MGLMFIYAFFAILLSFLCSVLEAVLLSISPTFLNLKKMEGKEYAFTLEKLKKDVDKPLITILTVNTIAHTVGAILAGIQAKLADGAMSGSSELTLFGRSSTDAVTVGSGSSIV